MHGYANKNMDDQFLVQKTLVFFQKVSIRWHILYQYIFVHFRWTPKFHVTLQAIEQTQTFWLDMITLPSHISHAFHPLDMVCFKLFKTTFRKEKDVIMVNNNYIEPYKITLASQVEKVLDQSLTKKNILLGFKVQRIQPLNPITIHEKKSLTICTQQIIH